MPISRFTNSRSSNSKSTNNGSTKKNTAIVEKRLYRFAFGLWGSVAMLALVAPWAYALSAALFATFLTFAALEDD